MSLVEVKNSEIVWKQVKYKLKTNMGIFTSLIVAQVIATLLTLVNPAGGIRGGGYLQISFEYYTIDIISLFILIWAFMIGMNIPKLMAEEATFIATHQTNTIANLIYSLIISCIAGTTTVFASYLQKVLLVIDGKELVEVGFSLFSDPQLFTSTIFVHILYCFLVYSIGYLVGVLVKFSRLLLIAILTTLIGIVLLELRQQSGVFKYIIYFFYDEPSMIVFLAKILFSVIVIFGISHVFSKRMEVGN